MKTQRAVSGAPYRIRRRRALSHVLRRLTGDRLSVHEDGALAERLRGMAAEQQRALGDSDQAELLARLLPPSHLPPELVAAMCTLIAGLLAEDDAVSVGDSSQEAGP